YLQVLQIRQNGISCVKCCPGTQEVQVANLKSSRSGGGGVIGFEQRARTGAEDRTAVVIAAQRGPIAYQAEVAQVRKVQGARYQVVSYGEIENCSWRGSIDQVLQDRCVVRPAIAEGAMIGDIHNGGLRTADYGRGSVVVSIGVEVRKRTATL